ncbi:hypothetical protein SAMN05216368_103116 [Cryobacterium flavum]|uniref:Uncharacterized protein n=1 Tax=Cryobacterium flavum TaxID=1424659 RepID=A0A5E9FVI2_9MICO|nr:MULTISPECIES: hypothetical protein [Cryobacterium]SDM97755.1 hypothetical protein SAMN05216368_103116 [Cryobacterium flavum]
MVEFFRQAKGSFGRLVPTSFLFTRQTWAPAKGLLDALSAAQRRLESCPAVGRGRVALA